VKDDRLYLSHILEAIDRVHSYTPRLREQVKRLLEAD